MIRWFANNSIAANFLMVGILLAGAYAALVEIPLEVRPSQQWNSVNIEMTYRGGTAKDVEKAIIASNLGLAPSSDGTFIRLTLPPLSEEQRKKLVGKVKEFAEEARVAMRNERRDANKAGDAAFKKHEISEDFHDELRDTVQDKLKAFEKRIDEIVAKKNDEVMND